LIKKIENNIYFLLEVVEVRVGFEIID